MALERFERLPGRAVPELHGVVRARRGQAPAVRAECHAIHDSDMAPEGGKLLAGRTVPDCYRSPAGRGQMLAVWAERHAHDAIVMALGGAHLLAGCAIPDSHRAIPA